MCVAAIGSNVGILNEFDDVPVRVVDQGDKDTGTQLVRRRTRDDAFGREQSKRAGQVFDNERQKSQTDLLQRPRRS